MNKVEKEFIFEFIELRRKLTSIIFYNIGKPNDSKSIRIADTISQSVLLTLFSARMNEYRSGIRNTDYYKCKDFFHFIKGKTPNEMIDMTGPLDKKKLSKADIKRIVSFKSDKVLGIFSKILDFKHWADIDPFFFMSRLSEEMISYRAAFYGSRVSFSIKNEWRSGSGSFYTPVDASEFIVKEAWSKSSKRCLQKVLDPTCGTGNLLLAYVKLLFYKFKPMDVVSAVENSIYGFDTNIKSLEILRYSLWNICYPYKKNPSIGKNLLHKDFLKAHKKKFDVCLLNPPFVKQGESRLEVLIADKALDFLSEKSVIALVIPSKFSNGSNYKGLRNRILSQNASVDICSFDIMPSSLFDQGKYDVSPYRKKRAVSVRSSIVIVKMNKGVKGKVRTTRQIRFKLGERGGLFDKNNLKYCTVPRSLIKELGVIPNVSFKKEIELLKKMDEFKSISSITSKTPVPGVGYIEVNSTARYFLYASIGKSVYSHSTFKIYPKTKSDLYNLYCYLNSNLFYWYWRKLTTSKDLSKSFVESAPIPLLDGRTAKEYGMDLQKKERMSTFKRGSGKNVNFNKAYEVLFAIDNKFLKSMRSATLWSVIKRSKSSSLYFRHYPF